VTFWSVVLTQRHRLTYVFGHVKQSRATWTHGQGNVLDCSCITRHTLSIGTVCRRPTRRHSAD